MKTKVITFKSGKPEVLGEVTTTAHKQAQKLLGHSPSVERVRAFGYCFVLASEGQARAKWNAA